MSFQTMIARFRKRLIISWFKPFFPQVLENELLRSFLSGSRISRVIFTQECLAGDSEWLQLLLPLVQTQKILVYSQFHNIFISEKDTLNLRNGLANEVFVLQVRTWVQSPEPSTKSTKKLSIVAYTFNTSSGEAKWGNLWSLLVVTLP